MKTKIKHLIDFEKVNSLLEGFNKTTGFVTAIIDLEGNVLSQSGWRQMCTEFHRIHPETAKNCKISDTELANKMAKGEKYNAYKCLNGLVDVVVPLIINGEHIANLFSGQFFFEKPDRGFFKKQAAKYGFDEKKYLEALDKVPVVSQEEVQLAMDFLLNMTRLISEMTLQKQEQSELNKELKESGQRYRTIFENTGTATCILEKDGIISLTNTKFAQLAGYPIHEIENKKTWMEFVAPEDLDRMYQQHELRRKNRPEALKEYEFRFIDKNKKVKNIFLTIDVIPGTDKSVASLLDITERKQAEQGLQEKNDLLEKVFNSNIDLIALCDLEGNFTLVGKSHEILGYDSDFLIGKNVMEFVHPDDVETVSKEFSVFMNTGEKRKIEYRYKRSDGAYLWFETIGTILNDNKGNPEQILFNTRNVTERKQAEDKLKSNYGLLRIAGETARFGGWDVDLKTNISTWSDAVADIHEVPHGYAPPVDEGINFYAPEFREKITQVFTDCAQKGIPYDEEMEIITSKGKHVWVRTTGRAVKDESGKISKVQGSFQDITESKQAEETLRESEKKLRTSLDATPFPIAVVDLKDDKIFFWSHSALELFGHTADTASEWYQMAYPDPDYRQDVVEKWKPFLEKAKNSGQTVNTGEYRITCKDGSERICELYATFLPDNLIVTFNNITERKQAEDALRESEEKYRRIADNVTDVVWVTDLEMNPTYISPSVERVFGVTPEEYLKLPITKTYPPASLEKFQKTLTKEFAKEQDPEADKDRIFKLEVERYYTDGTIGWDAISANFIRDEQSNPIAIQGVSRDITERKQAEEALEEKSSFLSTIMETSPVGIVTVDKTGSITYANNRAEQILGLEKEEITSITYNAPLWKHTDLDGSPLPDEKQPFNIVKKSLNTVLNIQHGITWPDGTVVILSINATPIKDHNGEFNGMIASIENITERKQAEVEIREMKNRYQGLFENSLIGIGLATLEGEIIDSNQAFANMLGYSESELKKINIADSYLNRDDRKRIVKILKEKNQIADFETRLKRKDNKIIDVLLNISVVKMKGITLLQTSCQDITDSKQAVEEIRKKEFEKSAILESMLNAFVLFESVFDENGVFISYRFLHTNRYYEEITGVKLDEVLGKTVHEVWPETEPEWIKRYGEVAVSGESQQFELYHDPTKKIYHCQVYRPFSTNTRFCVIFEDITERKQAEEALQESEQRFKALHNASFGGIAIHDKGVILECNQGLSDITGYSLDELIGMDGLLLIAPESRDMVMDNILVAYEKPYEAVGLRKNGEIYPLRLEARNIPYKGKTVRTVEFRDITESKKAEEALRQSEERMRSIYRVAPTGIGVVINRVLKDVNPRFCEMTGYAREELIGKNARMLYPSQEEHDFVGKEKYEQIRKKGTGEVETRWIKKDGTIIHILLASTPIDKNDYSKGVTFTALDITERKQAALKLQQSENRYRTIFNSTSTVTLLVRNNTYIKMANEEAKNVTGHTAAELAGTKWTDHVAPHSLEKMLYYHQLRRTNQEEVPDKYEVDLIHKSGEIRRSLLTIGMIPNSELSIVTLLDITKRKKAEDELRKLKENLETEVQEKTKELKERVSELERFQEATIEREFRIKELRDEIELLKQNQSKK